MSDTSPVIPGSWHRSSNRLLLVVKLAHTIVWAFFAACVVGIPLAGWTRRFGLASLLIGLVAVEVAILLVNAWRCPLTAVAARYTDDRRDNFDIYLPLWLARHNKTIFGALYVAGIVFTMARWAGYV